MPHIHTKVGEHDQTVSAYIVNIADSEPKLILHKHKKLDKYMQFGGHIELDEDPWQAISHEIEEESGYKMSQLLVLQPLSRIRKLSKVKLHPAPLSYLTHDFDQQHNHIDTAFAFVTSEKPATTVARGELDDFIQLNSQQLGSLDSA